MKLTQTLRARIAQAVILLAPRIARAAARGKTDADAAMSFRTGLRALQAVAGRGVRLTKYRKLFWMQPM